MSENKSIEFPTVNISDVREIEFVDFLKLLDSNSRLRDLHCCATMEYVSFFYIDNSHIVHLGFIRNDFKCFIGGI